MKVGESLDADAPIREYEDGRVAWSIANVLRTDGRDGTESLASHSPQLSISSRGMRDSMAGGDEYELPSWKIGAGQLALRHRDRGGVEPRPITNVSTQDQSQGQSDRRRCSIHSRRIWAT